MHHILSGKTRLDPPNLRPRKHQNWLETRIEKMASVGNRMTAELPRHLEDPIRGLPSQVLPWSVIGFLLVLAVPHTIAFYAGSFLVTSYRAYMIAIFPLLLFTLARNNLRLTAPDVAMLAFTIWAPICIFLNFENSSTERSGQFLLEVPLAYFLGRVCFTSFLQLKQVVVGLFFIAAVAALIGIPEAISHQKPIIEWTSRITGIDPGFYNPGTDVRMGMRRAQAFFENTILFGLFGCSLLAFVWYLERRPYHRLIKLCVIGIVVFLSLSTTPAVAAVTQIIFITIETATRRLRNRAIIITAFFALGFMLVEVIYPPGAFGFLVNYVAFNPISSYNRILIWNYGLENLAEHPWFGLNPENWRRAWFMGNTIDNFWIYNALLTGVFGWVLVAAIPLLAIVHFSRVRVSFRMYEYIAWRRAWTAVIVAFVFAGFAVAFFGRIQPFYYFLLGTGVAAAEIFRRDARLALQVFQKKLMQEEVD